MRPALRAPLAPAARGVERPRRAAPTGRSLSGEHMISATLWRSAGLGFLALLLSFSLYSCGASGTASSGGVVHVPFVGDIEWSITVSNGQRTYDVHGGADHSGRCVEMTWSDLGGRKIETVMVRMDEFGSASGPVPADASYWEVKVVKCPPKSEDKKGKCVQPPSLSGDLGRDSDGALPLGAHSDVREFLVFGTPVAADDSPGVENDYYAFVVYAEESHEVDALLRPILEVGPGAVVPDSVEVLFFSSLTATATGATLRTSWPGVVEQWDFDLNRGAFTASLDDGATVQRAGDWDVVEVDLPLAAFEFGTTPGAFYANSGQVEFKTDRMPRARSGGFELEYAY